MLEALAVGPDLRYVRCNGVELLRRIYVAIRGRNWSTLVPASLEVQTAAKDDVARLSWHARFDEDGIVLATDTAYELHPDGCLVASFRAEALADFQYNRMGLCVVYPTDEFAGRLFTACGPEHTTSGVLPERIGPQSIVDGCPTPIFPAFSQLELRSRSGGAIRLEFEGDLFEVEDQRNWTDDSFKIYSTPLALLWPRMHEAHAGDRFEQHMTMHVETPPPRAVARSELVSLTVGEHLGRSLPRVGVGVPDDDEPLSAQAIELLRDARLGHVHVPVPVDDAGAEHALEHGQALAAALGCGIQLAVTLGEEPEQQLSRLARRVERLGPEVRDVVVFATGVEAAGAPHVRLAREQLAPVLANARFHGGTDAHFCQLNRTTLDTEGLDGVSYAVHPQEHATDDRSLFETLAAQGETVRSTHALHPGLMVLVGPVTLKPRFSAAATEPEVEGPGGLPPQVDPRQCSLLGAAWTAGSLKHLAEAGADVITYYETTGWRGLIERSSGLPAPTLFPSRPGEVFPLYHVLADAADLRGPLRSVESDQPLSAVALATEHESGLSALVANLRAERVEVELGPLPAGRRRIRRLNAETAALAAAEPQRFRDEWQELDTAGDRQRLRLEPYEVARLKVG